MGLQFGNWRWESELSCPHFWIPLFGSGNDSRGSLVKKKEVKRGYLMSLS
jgi:hypothetical protein